MKNSKVFPDISDISFIDPPEENISIESYNAARSKLVDFFSKSNDVVSLYEFGTVNAPGISDIDLMLILKDSPSEKIQNLIKRDLLDKTVSYLMMGSTLMLMRETDFKKIKIWDNMNLKNLFGKKIECHNVLKDEFEYVEIARVLDWLPERTMRMLELIIRKEIPIRATLCLLNSFMYILQRLEKSFDFKFGDLNKFIDDFNNLRKNWFLMKENKDKALYSCLKKCIELGFKSIINFDNYCIQNKIYDTKDLPATGSFRLNPKITNWTKKKMYYNFSKDIKNVTLEESYKRSVCSNNKTIIMLPVTYYQHLAYYASKKIAISKGIYESLNPEPVENYTNNIDNNHQLVLEKRIKVVNDIGSFLRKNKINKGLFRYGWFL